MFSLNRCLYGDVACTHFQSLIDHDAAINYVNVANHDISFQVLYNFNSILKEESKVSECNLSLTNLYLRTFILCK